MTGGGKAHEPLSDERCDAVHQHEMAQMIGTELGFKTIRRPAFRAGHHTGIGNDHIERPARPVQPVRAGTHARKRGEIQLDQLEAATSRSRVPHYLGSPLSLGEVARRADYKGTMCGKDARGVGRPSLSALARRFFIRHGVVSIRLPHLHQITWQAHLWGYDPH